MADSKDIKAVVFDYGGVIKLNGPGNTLDIIADIIGVPHEEFKRVYREHNHLVNLGNMKWEDMAIKVVQLFNKSVEMESHVRSLLKIREAEKRINNELLVLFTLLRQKGFKLAILSNFDAMLRQQLKKEGILELVDEVVISGETGFQKPHKEAFDVLFKKLGLKPEEVVFVDDSAKSLEKAGEIGYIPILFKNNEQLKDELGKLGII